MVEDYQLWPHGYAAIATLRAVRPALKHILHTPCTLDAVVKATKANAGHLQVSITRPADAPAVAHRPTPFCLHRSRCGRSRRSSG